METAASGGLSPHAAALIADDAEAAAYTDFYANAPAALRTRLGLRVERVADAALLLAPGLPAAMFNRTIGVGLRHEADAAQVEAIARIYQGAGCKDWWLHWNPHAAPGGFPAQLAGLGFTQPARRSWAKVLRGAEPAPRVVTDLRIEPAAPERVREVTSAIATAFEMPPFMGDWLAALHGCPRWRLYAVMDGADVVGGGCLFTSGEVAWLGMGAVLASHRRRGGQQALMARRIADAVDAGARYLVTETGEAIGDEPNPSLANMKRCGFVTVASRLNYAGPT